MGSPHPKGSAGYISNSLLKHCPDLNRVFACGYRLSSSAPFPAANPFPAGLIDVLSGYNYLIKKLGFKPGIIEVNIARGHLIERGTMMLANNPISIIWAGLD